MADEVESPAPLVIEAYHPPPTATRTTVMLWLLCAFFAFAVCYVFVLTYSKVERIENEQARRLGVITEIEAIRGELALMRQRQEERAMRLTTVEAQMLVNVLNLTKVERRVESLEGELNNLKYRKRGPLLAPDDEDR